ncbi:sensor domain-containing diguanylate cyclase [Paenibacillus spongiae]|uniref:Sensor domain-containing diguanylate cyclase n=1 Tax=Paenibacillus spongiae TaxID=2909671 RepID=A0ABY5S4C2_9BACL|nr:sensor domain-containing diguanylate cyclase [Paenibacillus spongiae]UVI28756.1 sensor domain-containing diguanylate cyclase [Paenibacillus spongiae]
MLRTQSIRNKKKISLTVMLPLLVTFSILFSTFILIFVSYQAEKKTLMNTTLELNYVNATKMSDTINSLFKAMKQSLKSTASYMSANTYKSASVILAELDLIRGSSNYFNSLFWADETGLIHTVSPSSIGLAGQTLSTPASKIALALQQPYLSAPYIGTTNRLIVLMTEPVFDSEGRYRGFIGGTIYLQEANVIYDIFGLNTDNETGSYFYIVGPQGDLIFHPDRSRLGEDVSGNDVVQKLARGESGMEQVVNTRGVSYLAGFSAVAENNWGVIMQTPESTVYRQLTLLVREQLLNMLVPVLLMMAAAIFIAIKLAKPFVKLSALAARLSDGDAVSKNDFTPHWNKEANQLSHIMSLAVESVERQKASLSLAAATDQLTGLYNRRMLEESMRTWLVQGMPFSLIVLDIDRFKSVNDRFGHQTGDEVLKHLARVMSDCVRLGDICCRFGGEEFVILLPQAASQTTLKIAEDIRRTMERAVSPCGEPVTVSLGIAEYPLHADNADKLFQLADTALYTAKHEGRNRIVVAAPELVR